MNERRRLSLQLNFVTNVDDNSVMIDCNEHQLQAFRWCMEQEIEDIGGERDLKTDFQKYVHWNIKVYRRGKYFVNKSDEKTIFSAVESFRIL